MPSGQAHGVTFDSGGDVIAVGNDGGSAKVVKLSGSTGTLVSTFGSSGTRAIAFPSMVNSALYAVMDSDPSLSGDVIIGGYGNESGLSNCWLGLAALDDGNGSPDTLFGTNGYDTVNVGNDMSGVEQPSYNDAIYSLMWDDEMGPANNPGAIVGIGQTNELGYTTPVVWVVDGYGNSATTGFGSHGLSVPNISETVYGGTTDDVESVDGGRTQNPTEGDMVIFGQDAAAPNGFIATRLNLDGTLDTTFGYLSSGTFRADFGTTSGATAAAPRGAVVESDASVLAVGYTGSGGNVAVARFGQENQISVGSPPGSPMLLATILPAAAPSPGLFSSAAPIGGAGGGPDDGTAPSDPLMAVAGRRPDQRHRLKLPRGLG